MREFQERRKRRSLLYSTPILIILFGAIWGLGTASLSMYEKLVYTREQRDEAENEYSALLEKESALSEKTAFLENERGREEIIRGQYGVVKDGEGVIVIVDPMPTSTENRVKRESFLVKLWRDIVSSVSSWF